MTGGRKIIEETIDDRFIKDALSAETLQIELERFQFHAKLIGSVGIGDGSEVRLSCLGTQAGELGTDNFNGVIASRSGIGEGFQLLGRRSIQRRHVLFLAKGKSQVSGPTVHFSSSDWDREVGEEKGGYTARGQL